MVRTCQQHPGWNGLTEAEQRRAIELWRAFVELRGFPPHIAAVLAVQAAQGRPHHASCAA